MAFYRLVFLRKYPITLTSTAQTKKIVHPTTKVVDWKPVEGNEAKIDEVMETIWCGGLNTSWLASDFNSAPDSKVDDGLICT